MVHFYDLQIAKIVFVEGNAFSEFGEHFTPLILGIVTLFGASFLFWTNDFEKESRSIIKLIISGLGYIFFTLYGGLLPFAYLGIVGIVIAVIVAIVAAYWTIKMPKSSKSRYQKIGLVIVLSVLLSTLAVELVKPVWGRVRFRSMGDNYELFTPWYSINGDKFLNFVPKIEEIKSFPSGHSQWAMLSMNISLIIAGSDKWRKHENVVLGSCLIFAGLMMFSRMMQGAHFLTDVTIGASTAFVIVLILKKLILKNELSK